MSLRSSSTRAARALNGPGDSIDTACFYILDVYCSGTVQRGHRVVTKVHTRPEKSRDVRAETLYSKPRSPRETCVGHVRGWAGPTSTHSSLPSKRAHRQTRGDARASLECVVGAGGGETTTREGSRTIVTFPERNRKMPRFTRASRWTCITYLLFGSTSAFLQMRFENRRPTPLMEVSEYCTCTRRNHETRACAKTRERQETGLGVSFTTSHGECACFLYFCRHPCVV